MTKPKPPSNSKKPKDVNQKTHHSKTKKGKEPQTSDRIYYVQNPKLIQNAKISNQKKIQKVKEKEQQSKSESNILNILDISNIHSTIQHFRKQEKSGIHQQNEQRPTKIESSNASNLQSD